MLILTRKPKERILIGENMILVLLGVHGNQAKLGIHAPKDVKIMREEIKDKPPKIKTKPVIKVKKTKRKVKHGKE